MRPGIRTATLLLFALVTISTAHAQAHTTDSRPLQLSVFGGPTGVFTGLAGGRNLSFTAGVDLGFGTYRGLLPMAEIRGTEPFDDGNVDAQKNALGGLRVVKRFRIVHPYGDILYGRGEIEYQGVGYLNPAGNIYYQKTNSNIFSFGGGIDLDISPALSIKFDGQVQSYKVPVTVSGELYAKPITLGVVYSFGFGQRHAF